MNSTRYVIIFTIVLTFLTALILAGMQELTKGPAAKNAQVFNRRAILSSLKTSLGKDLNALSDAEVMSLFDKSVEQVVLKQQDGSLVKTPSSPAEFVDLGIEKKKPAAERVAPLFIYKREDGKKFYILSVRGAGLWDEIWGNVAVSDDLNTVVGTSYDHKAETPGLGAEIKDNDAWVKQFEGKKLYKGESLVSVAVVKPGTISEPEHQVDGIAGATFTSNGVTEMLGRGIKIYEPYLKSLKSQK